MNSVRNKKSLFWFRRDLRLNDNRGLRMALDSGLPVLPIFIFDQEILNKLEDRDDARVTFIRQALVEMDRELRENGSSLHVYIGKPEKVFAQILKEHDLATIFTNKDYEPYAIERDAQILELAAKHGVEFSLSKDQVIFEENEVTKDDGKPYTMFTPYSRKWLAALQTSDLKSTESEKHLAGLYKSKDGKIPSLKDLGFEETSTPLQPVRPEINDKLIAKYLTTRNYPADESSTSRLGMHLRFGTVSVRDLMKHAKKATEKTWLKELIWREFFMQILWHFPHVVKGAFRPEYDKIPFRKDEADWKAWTEGKTGFAIVDAGMRELNATGFMHNRVRMIAASVLVKHFLIHWKEGEAYFARKLLDYELSSNNGNWQWVAGS
ncbi:MAG: deoxyribodipyrimidine photo-lyase, partial [Proteobacteria bacterium]